MAGIEAEALCAAGRCSRRIRGRRDGPRCSSVSARRSPDRTRGPPPPRHGGGRRRGRRSGRDAIDLPDGDGRRDPPAGRADRGRAGRPVRAAPPSGGATRSSAARCSTSTPARGVSRRRQTASGSRRWPRRSPRATRLRPRSAARLDLHGAIAGPMAPLASRCRGGRRRPPRSRRGGRAGLGWPSCGRDPAAVRRRSVTRRACATMRGRPRRLASSTRWSRAGAWSVTATALALPGRRGRRAGSGARWRRWIASSGARRRRAAVARRRGPRRRLPAGGGPRARARRPDRRPRAGPRLREPTYQRADGAGARARRRPRR